MPKQVHWNKIISSALVFSLLAGTSVYAAEDSIGPESAAAAAQASEQGSLATPFSDVKRGHWAEKHIAKLFYQGIITGLNGAFRPADSVSQQEAVIMALRFMGKAGDIKNNAVVFPSTFEVSNFYKPYVEEAFRIGLLDRMAEYELAEAGKDEPWGLRKASREWITKLAVRAIGQRAKAEEMASETSAFADASLIGKGYAGYINAAQSLKLVNGVSANRFDPKGDVNRAMLATIFSRAEAQAPVAYEGQTNGVIGSLAADAVVLVDKDGKETSYQVTAGTLFAQAGSEKLLQRESIQPYTDAVAIVKDGKVLYLEQIGTEVKTETVSGTLASVVAADRQLYIKLDTGKFQPVDYAESTTFTDSAGGALAVDKLSEGSKITVTVDTFRTKPMALNVRVVGALVNKTGQGTIVSAAGNTVTIKDNGGEAGQSWDVAPGLTPTWQDRVIALTDLRAGDSVSYEVANSVITKLTVLSTSGRTITGLYSSINTSAKTITFLSNGKPDAKLLADNVRYMIEGLDSVSAADLVEGDMLELTVNELDRVTQVKVTNRKVETMAGALVINYAKAKKALTVEDAAGNIHAFQLSDNVRLELDGTQLTLASAETFLVAGKRVTLRYTGKNALALQFVYKYTGKVTAINSQGSQLTLALAGGSSITVPYSSPIVDIYGKSSSSLADVKVGDTITARLDGAEQSRVITIQVHRSLQQEVVSVDAAARKLRLRAADGTVTEWAVGSDWTITDEAGAPLALAALNAGAVVNVTYAGKQPAEVKRVRVTVGKVTAIAPDKVTLTDYKGVASDITLGAGFRIVKGGTASGTVAALAAGDRVDVRKDENGSVLITVIPALTKTFWRYDAAAGEIQVRHAVNENYRFAVTADTVITLQNGSAITASSLKDGDKIDLYVSNGKLIEVVKQ